MTPQSLVFQDDAEVAIEEVEWYRLEKINANAIGSATAMLRLTRTNGKKHIFKFLAGRQEMEEARSDMKARWKLSQEVSMRDFGDEDFTETDFSMTEDFKSMTEYPSSAPKTSKTDSAKPSVPSSTSNKKSRLDRDFESQRSSSLSKLQEETGRDSSKKTARRASASNIQQQQPTSQKTGSSRRKSTSSSAKDRPSSPRKDSLNSLTLSMTSSEGKSPKQQLHQHSMSPKNSSLKEGTPEYVAYISSQASPSSKRSRSSKTHPSQAAPLPPPPPFQSMDTRSHQSQNLTLLPNDRVMVHTRGKTKPELILDFSTYAETQQIKVWSLQETTPDKDSLKTGASVSHRVHLMKPLEGEDGDNNQQDKDVEANDQLDKKVDYKHFQFAGYKCSKKSCFFTSMIACCLCLMLIITAIILIVYFLVIEDDKSDSDGNANEDAVDDFYTRYQNSNNDNNGN